MSARHLRTALAAFTLAVAGTVLPAIATPSNAFYLQNDSNKVLHFLYGCEGGTMYARTVPAARGWYFWVKNGCTLYTIKKTTDMSDGETKTFTYTLTAGHRYEIFWDRAKQAWNIREL